MKSPKRRRPNPDPCGAVCPVRAAADLLGGKWTLLVIRELMGGRKRFGELLGLIGGISPRVLTQRLQLLEGKGILSRTYFPEVPPRVEYTLEPLGEALRPVVEALGQWGSLLT